jgi:hypothetical protein
MKILRKHECLWDQKANSSQDAQNLPDFTREKLCDWRKAL